MAEIVSRILRFMNKIASSRITTGCRRYFNDIHGIEMLECSTVFYGYYNQSSNEERGTAGSQSHYA